MNSNIVGDELSISISSPPSVPLPFTIHVCNSCTSYVGGDYCPDCAQHDCCVARPPEDWDCGPFEAHYLVTLSEDLKQIEKVQLWYHLN
jgi:hypothetical protein